MKIIIFLILVILIFEIVIFIFYIAPKNPVGEINRGGLIRIPKFFNKIFKIYLPLLLVVLFASWLIQDINSSNSIIFKKSLWSLLSKAVLISLFVFLTGIVFRKVYKK